MVTTFKNRLRKSLLDGAKAGTVAGIYLRPERRSTAQFPSILISQRCFHQAAKALNSALDHLYAAHGIRNVEWYVDRSLGLDVQGRIAWCNLDITDAIVP